MNVIKFNQYGVNDLIVSVIFHVIVFVSFLVTFPSAQYPIKPHLVFLGSFLSEQDMMPLQNENDYGRNLESNTINMNVRQGVYHQSLMKPGQHNQKDDLKKQQYKPLMAVEPLTKTNKALQEGESGESFETLAPVRMKWIFDDQD